MIKWREIQRERKTERVKKGERPYKESYRQRLAKMERRGSHTDRDRDRGGDHTEKKGGK